MYAFSDPSFVVFIKVLYRRLVYQERSVLFILRKPDKWSLDLQWNAIKLALKIFAVFI